MGAEVEPGFAAELAERMVRTGERPAPDVGPELRREIAWRLKDLCYGAWSSEPQRAVRAAEALDALRHEADAGESPGEIDALAEWTAGIAHLTRGEMAAALASLDAAAAVFGALGEGHKAAQTQVPKIMALAMLGRDDEAASNAAAIHREFVRQGDHSAAAKVSLNLGSLYLRRDAFPDAAAHYREAAVLFARAGDFEHSVMADIGLADALTALGDFDEAVRMYARARMRAAAHDLPVLWAMQEESVALLELARGRYREALAGLEKSRRGYESLAMPQHLAIAEKQLADAYLELRLLPEALALYDKAIAEFEAQAMPHDLASALAQRGRTQALLEHFDLAAGSLRRAEELFVRQDNPVGRAAVALARAELALATGDPVGAIEHAREAAAGFTAAELPDRSAHADLVLAEALLRRGAHAQARDRFAALLERSRELQLLSLQVRCLDGLGTASLGAGDRAGAHAALNDAVVMFEQQRAALPADDIRSAFLTDHLRPYRELLRMALQDHERLGLCETAGDVLVQLDRFRARSLSERLVHGGPTDQDPGTSDLRSRVSWLHRRVQRVQDEAGSAAALLEDLHRTERELLERSRRQALLSPAARRLPDSTTELEVEALRGSLAPGDAIVEYGVLDDELFACAVTTRGITVHRHLCRWSDALDALRSTRFQIETLRHGVAPVAQHLDILAGRAKARLSHLFDLLWAPLAQVTAEARRVLVVPHGPLGSLPFAALHDGEAYLGSRVEFAMAPSARLAWRGLRRMPVAAQDALAFGVADQLPHAIEEASFVAGLFPRGRAFLGAAARVDAFFAESARADVIHLACHAQFRSDNPMFSSLYLHDGTLSVEAAEKLALRPGVVVLSGCETGLAQESAGDEVVGLVRAFFIAGAARVVASLWPVDDAVTAHIMAGFYGALRDGLAPAAALQQAQNSVMKEHPHPFYWASFTLYGGF